MDVPEIQIVHTAEFVLKDVSTNPPHITGVGEMIQAELIIHHTRRWCPTENRAPPESLEFSYEILCSPEVWLVGGRRRGNFTCEEGESRTFQIFLLPQRAGHLLLPTVDVKSFTTSVTTDPAAAGAGAAPAALSAPQRQQISSEVDYRNHGEMVLVTPNLSTTMVDLGEFGAGGEARDARGGHRESGASVELDKRVSIATG